MNHRPTPRPVLAVLLGLGAAAASAPCAALACAVLSAAPPPLPDLVLFAAVSAAGIGGGALALRSLLRAQEPSAPGRGLIALALVAVQCAAAVGLDRLAPFRIGALSVVLFTAPAVIAAAIALASSRTARLAAGAAGVCLGAGARPLGLAQQHWAANAWITAHHITVPDVIEVIDMPGMRQLPYQYDPATHQLTAMYTQPLFGMDAWAALETVTTAAVDPCGPLDVPDGDGLDTETPGCTQFPPDLWQRADTDGTYAFVLRRGALTLTLAEYTPDDGTLLAALMTARPATDADLWQRTAALPTSLEGWLLR